MSHKKSFFLQNVSTATLAIFLGQSIAPPALLMALAADDPSRTTVTTQKNETMNSCDQAAAGDQDGDAHCKMVSVYQTAAVAQGVAALSFTAAGTAGGVACLAQSNSKEADKTACATASLVDANGKKIDSMQKEIQTQVTGPLTTQVGAVQTTTEATHVVVDAFNKYSTSTVSSAGGTAATAAAALVASTFGKATAAVVGEFNTALAKQSEAVASLQAADSTFMTKQNELLTADLVGFKGVGTQATATTNAITAYAPEADNVHTSCDAASNSPAQAAKVASTGPEKIQPKVSERQTAETAGETASKSADSVITAANQQVTTATNFSSLASEFSTTAMTLYQKSITNAATSAKALTTAAQSLATAVAADLASCGDMVVPATIAACQSAAGAASAPVQTANANAATLNGQGAALSGPSEAMTKPATTLATTAGKFVPSVTEIATKAETNKTEDTDYIAQANKATIARQHREVTHDVYQVIEWAAYGTDVLGAGAVAATTLSLGGKISTAFENIGKTGFASTGGADVMGLGAKVVMGASGGGGASGDMNCSLPLPVYAMDLIQAGKRVYDTITSVNGAEKEREFSKMVKTDSVVFTPMAATALSGGGGSAGNNGGASAAPVTGDAQVKRDATAAEKANVTPHNLASSLASAQDRAVIPKLLEQLTGTTSEQQAEKLLSGQSPMMVAAQSVGSGSTEAAILGFFDKNKDKIADLAKDDLNELSGKIHPIEFASAGASRGRRPSSGGDDIDMASLLAGLMKKPETHAGAPGAKPLPAPATYKANSDGLHSSDKSLFEVVGTRYQLVQKSFLAGDTLTLSAAPNAGGDSARAPSAAAPATLMPKNPYLRK